MAQASTANLKSQVAARASQPNEIIYTTEGGSQVTLSPQIVRQYLVNGQGNVSDQEVMMFLQLCKYQGLNPFLREAYLIKYGSAAATIVVGKEVFTKRAERHPEYRGIEAGIYVQLADGNVKERKGSMTLPTDRVVGGWAKVYREGYAVPIEAAVSFDEYAGRKNDGSLNNQWATKPATMIRKVAVVQALREAFPSEFGGMYSQEEISTVDGSLLSEQPIQVVGDSPQTDSAPMGDRPQGELISEAQSKRMYAISKGEYEIAKDVLGQFGYESSKDVSKSDYNAICDAIGNAVESMRAKPEMNAEFAGDLGDMDDEALSSSVE